MNQACLFWALVAALAWGITPLLEKLGLLKANPGMVMFIQAFVVFTTIATLWWLRNAGDLQEQLNQVDTITILCIVGAAILGGFIGEYAYLRAISFEGTGIAVALTSIYPLITILLTSLFLGEKISLSGCSGAFLIVVGILLLSSSHSSAIENEPASTNTNSKQMITEQQ